MRRGGRVWVMDERFDEGACDEAERRRLLERLTDKAVRERRAWLAERAAKEPSCRETEEVKRTGPASPAPC